MTELDDENAKAIEIVETALKAMSKLDQENRFVADLMENLQGDLWEQRANLRDGVYGVDAFLVQKITDVLTASGYERAATVQ